MAKKKKAKKKVELKIPAYHSNTLVKMNCVEIKKGVQTNKYYNMLYFSDKEFVIQHGRVGSSKKTLKKDISLWASVYREKILRKNYKVNYDYDIHGNGSSESDPKVASNVVSPIGDGESEFFDVFSQYAGLKRRSSYNIKSCTQEQMDDANKLLHKISGMKKIDSINKRLMQLYTTIPRRMGDVNDYLCKDRADLPSIVAREQDALDSMDSSNISSNDAGFDPSILNCQFEEVPLEEIYSVMDKFHGGSRGHSKIYKAFRVRKDEDRFENFLNKSHEINRRDLIHGTRNANIFSILKSGLRIRPSNAFHSGSAYGDGIYHASDILKSMGYTGGQNDKILLIQDVNLGKQSLYKGWYTGQDSRGLKRSKMNYQDLNELGYDSLYARKGNGLLGSEYIVYREEQTNFKYLVWYKR